MLALLVAVLAVFGHSPATILSEIPDAPAVVRISLGDDNADGAIDEDESGWSCTIDGNRRCGPPR
ncbi:hypothetical protein CH262_08380 [Rhodococcus sp. 05-2255-1e]|nr:hypothetical protein CH262_08380 [Rhodococcus sp. 05-2255-1e]